MIPTELRIGAYRVWELDPRNICAEFDTGRQSKDKDGNEKGETIKEFLGYHDGIANALKACLRHGLRGQGAVTAKQLIAHIDKALAAITTAVDAHA